VPRILKNHIFFYSFALPRRNSGECVHVSSLSPAQALAQNAFGGTSGNIRLNTSPLILSGSSFGESFGWVSSLSAEDTASGGCTSSEIIGNTSIVSWQDQIVSSIPYIA